MKNIILSLLLFQVSLIVSAQKTDEKTISGKWSLTAATTMGLYMDLTSPENLSKSMYESLNRLAPGKVLSAEDSVQINGMGDELKKSFSGMFFVFKSDGTCTGLVDVDGEEEEFTGTYQIKKDKLILYEKGQSKSDKIELQITDKNAMKWVITDKGNTIELIFSKS